MVLPVCTDLFMSAIALVRAHQVDEAREQIMAVARAGRSLGMILHREYRPVFERQPAVRAVEQRHMRLRACGGNVVRSIAKPWFIDVISTLPVLRSLTGWFAP